MATFAQTLSPTPFGFFDADTSFQSDADSMITYVRRKLGDDILSVELTKKQIWACFEESFLEFGVIINSAQAKSQLGNLLGNATGSLTGSEQKFPRENLEFMLRRGEPYSMEAGLGGSFDTLSGSIDLQTGRQDYDIYTELKDQGGTALFDNAANNPKTKMRIFEVFHFTPQAAYRFFDSTSAINYLNNEFSFESFTPETVFYVLPVFEDVLRGGMLDMSSRVRRSNYSFKIMGTKLRIYPVPTAGTPGKIWLRVAFSPDVMNPSFQDKTIDGVSNLSNVPFGNLAYGKINSIGRQWTRQYAFALAKELLGQVRSKFSAVPIPGGDLSLNGGDLISQAREEQEKLRTSMVELLDSLTYSKLLEDEAGAATNLQTILKSIPVPNGQAIIVG